MSPRSILCSSAFLASCACFSWATFESGPRVSRDRCARPRDGRRNNHVEDAHMRWLSLAAMTVSSSWVNVDRSAFLCRYWRSSRLMFSLVPRCHGSK
jgi:hypothetical protein